jgi:predicted amidohydrolase
MLEEDRYLKSGSQIKCLETPWGRLGLATCYDLRFPEIFRRYALENAEMILLSAEWPAKRIEHWKLLLRARAIENQVFIAAVNKTGISQGAKLGGNSSVIDPMGEILVQGDDQPGILIAEIDPEQVRRTRNWMPVFQDRKPDVY